jgi:hypothetical protein
MSRSFVLSLCLKIQENVVYDSRLPTSVRNTVIRHSLHKGHGFQSERSAVYTTTISSNPLHRNPKFGEARICPVASLSIQTKQLRVLSVGLVLRIELLYKLQRNVPKGGVH